MRARNIKPGLYKNAELAECSIEARFLAPGLWMLADKEGRLADRTKQIKGEVFPYDNVDIERLLIELVKCGHIIRYEVGEQRFIQICKFKEHQRPHSNEKDSIIPPIQQEVNKTNKLLLTKVESVSIQGKNHFALNADTLNAESHTCVSDFQKVFEVGEKLFPSLATKSTTIVRKWLEDGCIPETDIIPEITRAAGKAIQSWTYFTAGIMNAKATRENPLPAGTPGKPKNDPTVFKSSAPVAMPDEKRADIIRWNMKRNGYAVNAQDEEFLRAYDAKSQPEAQHA